MRIETELCHIDSSRIIVKARAWEADSPLGSTLGEAETVDEAESIAIKKLYTRLKKISPNAIKEEPKLHDSIQQTETNNSNDSKYISNTKDKELNTIEINNSKNNISLPKVPEDWSKELALIDNYLSKLNWNKEQEGLYLDKLFGYKHRSRITNYKDIKIFLCVLKLIDSGEITEESDLDKEALIKKSNIFLDRLNWDTLKGRQFLNDNFRCNTRKELSKMQLLEFIMLLDEELSN